MSIDEAKEEFDFFNEGDYITREMSIAKDVVLQELENTRADLYESNNRIADLLLILGDRDRMINKMAEQLTTPIHDKEWIIKYYERESKNAKD
jgi:hypothetical protein